MPYFISFKESRRVWEKIESESQQENISAPAASSVSNEGEASSSSARAAVSVSSGQNTAAKVRKAKLPKLTLSKFDRCPTTWALFCDCFASAVHENSQMDNIEKFQYLKSLLEKTAAKTISGLPLTTSSNYLEAIELLKARYSDKQIIIWKHMDALMQLPRVSSREDLQKLRFIYDKTEGTVRSLQGIGITSETYGTFLTPVIMGKLPPDLSLTLSRKLCEEWNLNSLLKALGTELTLREKCSLTSGASATSSRPREEMSQQSYYRNNPRQPTATSTTAHYNFDVAQ